ncbi:VOC family protein [Bacillus sp. CGMCC 1.16541]|uniref:VOC family protein n=1 Tax=Bacillus sp. CGMCC 1.16541 TaxID=2185143 RepID=UPI00194F98DA|nr:VOC family protein [Bacillus sp. CGMCC 1.16541]
MPTFIQGIDHIQLTGPKGCEEEARTFYVDKLGLTEIPKPESLRKNGGVWFQCGNQEVHIGVEEGFTPQKKAHPAFVVKHLRTFRQHLRDVGIATKEDTPIAGRERFFVQDPFGNRIEFLEYE